MFSMPYACGGQLGQLFALFLSVELFSLGHSLLGLFSWRPFYRKYDLNFRVSVESIFDVVSKTIKKAQKSKQQKTKTVKKELKEEL